MAFPEGVLQSTQSSLPFLYPVSFSLQLGDRQGDEGTSGGPVSPGSLCRSVFMEDSEKAAISVNNTHDYKPALLGSHPTPSWGSLNRRLAETWPPSRLVLTVGSTHRGGICILK